MSKDIYSDKVEISVIALIEIKRAFSALIKDNNSYLHRMLLDDPAYMALKELKSVYAEYFERQEERW